MHFKNFFFAISFLLIFAACKKASQDAVATMPVVTSTPPVTLSDDLLKDSVVIYSNDNYLWNTQVP
ncbi:MAG: hypothetical protein ABIS01_11770, partial [Ferruginibacter sp.]